MMVEFQYRGIRNGKGGQRLLGNAGRNAGGERLGPQALQEIAIPSGAGGGWQGRC